jgi:hypothetical protein
VRWQRQDAGKRSGADGDHHEQAHAKSADGCGQDDLCCKDAGVSKTLKAETLKS